MKLLSKILGLAYQGHVVLLPYLYSLVCVLRIGTDVHLSVIWSESPTATLCFLFSVHENVIKTLHTERITQESRRVKSPSQVIWGEQDEVGTDAQKKGQARSEKTKQ